LGLPALFFQKFLHLSGITPELAIVMETKKCYNILVFANQLGKNLLSSADIDCSAHPCNIFLIIIVLYQEVVFYEKSCFTAFYSGRGFHYDCLSE
jgi:hypothetical protein